MKTENMLQAAWRARCPLVWIEAPDILEASDWAIATVERAANGSPPVVRVWNHVKGWQPAESEPPALNPVDAVLEAVASAKSRTLCIGQRLGEGTASDVPWAASINLARRALAKAQSMLCCVVPYGASPPPSLSGDFVTIRLELPTAGELEEIARKTIQAALKGRETPFGVEDVVSAIRPHLQGMTRFGAEQVAAAAAMESVFEKAVSVGAALEARRQILRSSGLQVIDPQRSELPGLEGLLSWLRLFPADIVCWIDEIEKAIAGATGGDTSGVSQDQLGVLLNVMQERQMWGVLLVGPPGTGKSETAKQIALSMGVPLVGLDFGALKGSLVGQSEERVRRALWTVGAMGRVLVVATANQLERVPPELRRRFGLGTWFFDLPDKETRAAIWRVWMSRCGLSAEIDAAADLAELTEGWAGADVSMCCRMAQATGRPILECLRRVTPVGVVAKELRARLQAAAAGRWLDAKTGTVYQQQQTESDIRSF